MSLIKALIHPVTPFQQNATILYCEDSKKCAFIDPGGDIDILLGAAKENGLIPEKIFLTNGVFPVPPRYMLPTHITGIGNFFWVLILLIIKLIIKYIADNGNSKIDQNDIFWLSQNFGFLNFIFK